MKSECFCFSPENAKQFSEPRLNRHHEGDGGHAGQTGRADFRPQENDDDQRLERSNPQVVQVQYNLQGRTTLVSENKIHIGPLSLALAYLVKAVYVIRKKVDDLPGGCSSHRVAAETQSLVREILLSGDGNWNNLIHDFCCRSSKYFTDLLVDHVTHGHSNPHANSENLIVVKMLEDRQREGGDGHGSSKAVRRVKTSSIVWVIVLKILNYFPQKKRLDDLNGFL